MDINAKNVMQKEVLMYLKEEHTKENRKDENKLGNNTQTKRSFLIFTR